MTTQMLLNSKCLDMLVLHRVWLSCSKICCFSNFACNVPSELKKRGGGEGLGYIPVTVEPYMVPIYTRLEYHY